MIVVPYECGAFMFPPELEREAFRSGDEFGWTRQQIPLVIDILRANAMGILGGELWCEGPSGLTTIFPDPRGGRCIYSWITDRKPGESWSDFVIRGASDALSAAETFPRPGELSGNLAGHILYNLTWVSETQFDKLRN